MKKLFSLFGNDKFSFWFFLISFLLGFVWFFLYPIDGISCTLGFALGGSLVSMFDSLDRLIRSHRKSSGSPDDK